MAVAVTKPKSCSRCGDRGRTEEFPTGVTLFQTYYNDDWICSTCAGELAAVYDRDGWPQQPWGEDEPWPTKLLEMTANE